MAGKLSIKLWLAIAAVLLIFSVWIDLLVRWQMAHQAADSLSLRLILAVSFLFTLPFAGIFGMLIARRARVTQQQIREFAAQLGAGDFSVRLHLDSSPDDQDTSDSLNHAAQSLGRLHEALDNSRRELTALLDSMEEAVIGISPEGLVSWSNAVLQRLSQYRVLHGKALVHTVRDPDVLSCVEEALRLRQPCRARAFTVAAGRVFEVNVAPMPSGGAVVVLHDVTKIEQAEISRRDFVANVSHELRTPLTSISGYVETLIESHGLPDEQVKEFLGVILKNASRVNRLTEDLLALARVEAKDYRLSPQPNRASVLVADAIESLAPLALDAGLKLQAGETTDDLVMADPDAMQQVFGNLIENAIKYGKEGRKIIVGCHRVGENVEFSVHDFGPGIASHHLSRIFERFYRVDTARSRENGGTGLGLAIVKRILEAQGGDIWVESEIGQGTSFLFRIPAIPAPTGAPVDLESQVEPIEVFPMIGNDREN